MGASPHPSDSLADAFLAELDDPFGVVLGNEGRTREHLPGRYRPVLGVVSQEDDRQVALQVLLLVHGEQDVAVADGLEHLG